MNYQVLARKWRPRSFSEMVGQAHVLRALVNALDNQRLHHAYLFTGTRGVGKTTIARIIAKCLNCEQGVSSTPCGQCSACRAIDEGRFVDLIEVDAASRTKVEDTRELLDNVQYAPSAGRYKVYLIDEVHMLSSHSFNALLKTLEEPPPHVKFLLATTDPQKLPITILSRCLQFSLKSLSPDRVVEHLAHVLSVEAIPFEQDALWLLGRAADGSMRDALTLTDQAIAFGEGQVLAADVRAMLGTLDHGQVYGLLHALFEADARALLEAVRQLSEQGPDWPAVLAEMLNVLHRIAIAQVLPDAVDNAQGDRERVLTLARLLPGEDVQFYYQLGLIGRRDLPLAPDPRSGFEMVMLRMLAFRPASVPGGPQTPLSISEAPVPPLATTEASLSPPSPTDLPKAPLAQRLERPVAPAPELPTPVEAALPATPTSNSAVIIPFSRGEVAAEPPSAPVVPSEDFVPPWDLPAPAPTPIVSAETETPAEAADEEPPFDESYYSSMDASEACFEHFETLEQTEAQVIPEASLAAQPASGLAADWIELLPKLGLSGLTGSIAVNCTLVSQQGDCWSLHLDPEQSALFNPVQQERLNNALSEYHGRALTLDIQICKPQQETPAQAAARARLLRQRQAEQAIEDDPLVQQLKARFSAVVREHSIEPLNNPR